MEYTSGKITTKHTIQFTYGYIETKIKLSNGKGIWPSFWMLRVNIDDLNWPDCGEIDILEAINEEKKIYHTLHWRNDETNEQGDKGDNKEVGLKWTEEEISMYIDEWGYDIGTGTNGWGTYQKQYYTKEKENIFLSDSN